MFCWFLLGLLMCTSYSNGNIKQDTKDLQTKDILFIVLSQGNGFHARLATEFQTHIEKQWMFLNQNERPKLLFTHTDFDYVTGAWTVFPLVEHIVNTHADKDTRWVVICEENTRINVSLLVAKLQQYNPQEKVFLGRELRDKETTIIHHFAFAENPSVFAYPDSGAGFVLSFTLVSHLHHQLKTVKRRTDFSIDPKYELALFIWEEGNGTILTHVSEFCSADASSNPACVTSQPVKFPDCGNPIEKRDLFVAVKTCQQFHGSRIPIVKATWGKETEFLEYYSEVADPSIPTVDLGVPNTDRGHCGKTMAILSRVSHSPSLSVAKWLLVADDDTIINLRHLEALLACYNPQEPVVLGERYGYGVVNGGGYDYITGGGGMVFSLPAVHVLAERCKCYIDNAPDDMTLGMCLKSIGINVTHSRYFHQARPEDYGEDFLANQVPVSFHKHWNNDPYKVYARLTSQSRPDKSHVNLENIQIQSTQSKVDSTQNQPELTYNQPESTHNQPESTHNQPESDWSKPGTSQNTRKEEL